MANIPKFSNLLTVVRMQFIVTLDRDLKSGELDIRNNDDFICILRTAIDVCGLSQGDIATTLDTSRSTFSRWIGGKILPYPQYRLPIILKLSEKIKTLIKDDVLPLNNSSERVQDLRKALETAYEYINFFGPDLPGNQAQKTNSVIEVIAEALNNSKD